MGIAAGTGETTRLDEQVHTVEGDGIVDAVRRRSGRDSCSVGRPTHVCGLGAPVVEPLVPSGGRWRPSWTVRPWYRSPLHHSRPYEASTRPGAPQGGGGSRFVARRCVDNGQIRGAFLLC